MSANDLDIFKFPLTGSSLIEASAGTGKTYTIAMLYLRLILPMPQQATGEQQTSLNQLSPLQILVVTFTDAAAQELRERIRTRLSQAASCFADLDNSFEHDEILMQLRQQYPTSQWLNCAQLLRQAEQIMDEAAILTIHSWCLRMLKQYVFNIGGNFLPQAVKEVTQIEQQIANDYWRKYIANLSLEQFTLLSNQCATPDAVLQLYLDYKQQQRLMQKQATAIESADLTAILLQTHDSLMQLKQPWLQWCDELQQILDAIVEQGFVDGRKLNSKNYSRWLADLKNWADDKQQLDIVVSKTLFTRISQQGLAEAFKPVYQDKMPTHIAIEQLAELNVQIEQLKQQFNQLLQQNIGTWVQQRVEIEKTRLNQLTFDDFIKTLAMALQGKHGKQLALQIHQQFPAAMIDEFQDTDQLQYSIFNAIYQLDSNAKDSAIVLIGDPKQSIYSFRNADIFTYLQAKQATNDRHYNLATNYRSSDAMVDAVNSCFDLANLQPTGAFYFKHKNYDAIPFLAVKGNGLQRTLLVDGEIPKALNIVYPNSSDDDKQNSRLIAEHCASNIVSWLNKAQQGRAGFTEIDQDGNINHASLQPLKPRDIAVLVNHRYHSALIRQALSKRGVNSVYLSDSDSVFASTSAEQLYFWLQACLNPSDDSLVRIALATPQIGKDWQHLDRFATDDNLFEQELTRFHAYRDCWRSQGVLVMLQKLLQDYQVLPRLIEQHDQRSITDILHLAEILQEQSRSLDSEQALLNFFKQQIIAAKSADLQDNHSRRLESDADLVQVVTVFKSKGLEYPLVFLPFASSYMAAKDNKHSSFSAEADGLPQLTPEQSRLAEDLRKLYVALTRARYYTWLGVPELKKINNSAVGYLLQAENEKPLEQANNWQKIVKDENISQQIVSDNPPVEQYKTNAKFTFSPALSADKINLDYWRVTSYSAFHYQPNWQAPSSLEMHVEPVAVTMPDYQALQDFPRGAKYGTFLHSLFEKMAESGFVANSQQLTEQYQLYLTSMCQQHQLREWQPLLEQASNRWLNCQYQINQQRGFSLAQLNSYISEMEFMFSINHADSLKLDKLVQQYCVFSAETEQFSRAPLQYTKLNGRLKGFIDLVFEHDGQYYVLDYKSNRLENYCDENLQHEIIKHRYDVQYVVYLFALHLLLKSRIADYDYDRHIGGAVYLFLRGIDQVGNGVYWHKPSKQLMLQLEQLLLAVKEVQ